MPKRTDIRVILIIGSGPIQIGQGCEFDYAGTQACKALREEGYKVILINSNPATIMTDSQVADVIYIEDINITNVTKIIKKERPDALLSTMGGQVALNLAVELQNANILQQYQVELLGANIPTILKAENRELFKKAMLRIGVDIPQSWQITNCDELNSKVADIKFPVVVRSSFTLGGELGGIADNKAKLYELCHNILNNSSAKVVHIEEYLHKWKEMELEVIRDSADNCIVVCGIENIDPMGIHTGDSITVAPIQTLTDKEYQRIRDIAFAVLREINVTTGGANVQFAVDPKTGRAVVIEMNPRVSRSSALASKATGFPIAKVAAKLAVGYHLHELCNEITGNKIPIAFEPTIDYVVVKFPKFNFNKFPEIKPILTTYMQAVGEVMALGSNFTAAFLKAVASLELTVAPDLSQYKELLDSTHEHRVFFVLEALRQNMPIAKIHQQTGIDPWFLAEFQKIISCEQQLATNLNKEVLLSAKKLGLSNIHISEVTGKDAAAITTLRCKYDITPTFKTVDSCAAEFSSLTSYYYSAYEQYCEIPRDDTKKIVIIGSGPNRIGQGIEFDYCCVHAVLALKQLGYTTVMINSNPETVSTDFTVTDRLFFEPLTAEYVLEVLTKIKPEGVIVQFGGQTAINLAKDIAAAGFTILGTELEATDIAEDRARTAKLAAICGVTYPRSVVLANGTTAVEKASQFNYPVIVRGSYIIGGNAMQVIANAKELQQYAHDYPIHVDEFISDGIEVDVDMVADGSDAVVIAILEHIEPTGIHSGDSHCIVPPKQISIELQAKIKSFAIKLAKELKVKGLCNCQFAIQGTDIYLIEINPRASRTIPFLAKALEKSLVAIAVKCMLGHSLAEQGITAASFNPSRTAIKQPIFPFKRLGALGKKLGPEMLSIGEVMLTGSECDAVLSEN